MKRIDGRKKILVHRNRLKRCFMRQENIEKIKVVKMDVGCQTDQESSEQARLCENNATVLEDSLVINEDNTPVKASEQESSGQDSEEETCGGPNLSKRVADIIKLTRRRRGRPPKDKALAKRAVRLIKHSKRRPGRPPKIKVSAMMTNIPKRRRGRPPCKKKSRVQQKNTSETYEVHEKHNSLQVQRLRTQPKRSCKKI